MAVVTPLVTGSRESDTQGLDAGLLVLRLGAGVILVLLLAAAFPNPTVLGMTGHVPVITGVALLVTLTVIGFWTRPTAALLALAASCSVLLGWHRGQQLLEEPVRALILAVLYAALVGTGAGRWSVDGVISRNRWAPATDVGLLILRVGAGLSLFALFGVTKIGWVRAQLHSPDPWNQWGFAKLIAAVGLPVPFFLSLAAVANETLTPLLVAAGLLMRPAAMIGAIGFAGAMYTSVTIKEEPLRAATYLVAFATLALTGAGRYSLDHVLGSGHALRRRQND